MAGAIARILPFLVVGGLGVVVDTASFTALRATILAPSIILAGPIIAKVVSTALAIMSNWWGNRMWTFRDRRRGDAAREGVEFAIVSVGGLGIGLACLTVSHYALGLTSTLSDAIAANGVGLVLGTAFRFWLYSTWVYGRKPDDHAKPRRGRFELDRPTRLRDGG